MRIAFFTEMGFEGKVPRNHPNMRTEFAWMCALNADHHSIIKAPFITEKYDLGIVIIPKKNLTNNEDNEEIYYSRLSDEFVRYNKFKNFIFEKSVAYNYGSVKYNILENETIQYDLKYF